MYMYVDYFSPPPRCSVGVVAASSECLRAVLATKTATFILSQLEEQSSSESSCEWCLYLEPFKPSKKKKVGEIT
jgi:hypothetical protein